MANTTAGLVPCLEVFEHDSLLAIFQSLLVKTLCCDFIRSYYLFGVDYLVRIIFYYFFYQCCTFFKWLFKKGFSVVVKDVKNIYFDRQLFLQLFNMVFSSYSLTYVLKRHIFFCFLVKPDSL